MATKSIDRVVVGVDNISQLTELIDAANLATATLPSEFLIDDEDLINPSRWNSL
jgi:hypothetical protein